MTTLQAVLARFRALPIATPAEVPGPRFAVLAPHPDDESLGCGGIIAAACAAGHPPEVLILTDGAASHGGSRAWPPPAVAILRAREVAAATQALGLPPHRLHRLGLPDGAAPQDELGISRAADAVAERVAGCDTLLVTWRHDPHCDHQSAYRIARRAAQRLGARLLEYPVWGWTLPPDTSRAEPEWRGWRVDIAGQLAAKRRAIAAHRSQLGQVIQDDPTAFVLPAALLALFDQPWETLVEAA